ncbi:MAG: hypothetical protein AB3N07_04515 [Ruegeria sp.]|uniref:hypothetical protein n=1 Tax=Ruegeria sp. ANG-S4 TaxID=1577904 RepID=UPI00057CD1DC|nr:hypothetical protein [Ruegeria sp. ANG-S4]KIC47030.1 hypothetical protein RA28_04795 [Ruegeria sp. ANG-S4]
MTTGKAVTAAILSAFWATAAPAQSRISPEAFLAAVEGKTVDFHEIRSGELVGTEQFLSPSLSVWRQQGKGCVYGQITTPDGQVCFLYDDDPDGLPVCWWPFEYEGRLLVRLSTFADAEIQEVRRITTDSLNCPSAPTS